MAIKAKTGVLIVNLGTPDSPKVSDVRKYLREFLMDGRVIDIPAIPRWILVNLIIAPFRAPKSAKVYQEVWTENGSPLKYYGLQIEKMLQEALGEDFLVSLGMRYQSPGITEALDKLKNQGLEQIIVLPLFPQYASATSGSVHQKVMEIVEQWQIIPEIRFIHQFYQHPLFVKAFAEIGKRHIEKHHYDHFIFTYHGLPERQIHKGDCTNTCLKSANCCDTIHQMNQSCYRAQCFETTRLFIKAMGLNPENCTTCFQSRLGKDPWIQPYTEDTIRQLAKAGKKNVLAFSPSFIADCLETTIEVGEEYKEVFEAEGGQHWQLVESLNDNPLWVDALKAIILEKIGVDVAV